MKDKSSLLDKKIHDYMIKLTSYFNSVSLDSKNHQILDESIFDFNSTHDIAIGLHSCNYSKGMHRHDFFEMAYVYKGTCYQEIDGKNMTLHKGELCLINNKAYHNIVTQNDEHDILFNFMFKKSFFTNYFLNLICENDTLSSFLINYLFDENSKTNYIVFNISEDKKVEHIILNIIDEFLDERAGFRSILESLFVILFIEISRNCSINNDYILSSKNKSTNINEIISYMEEHFSTTNLKKTAMHFHYNPSYLSKEIKKSTNKTYSEILQNIKLKHACFYLAKTNLSIQEIIDKIGYSESSHFYHIFKKNFTITPTEYRKQMIKN